MTTSLTLVMRRKKDEDIRRNGKKIIIRVKQ
jgi:hypothetical protein